eukprot:215419-Chlamydomonas_euryale.AAC.12
MRRGSAVGSLDRKRLETPAAAAAARAEVWRRWFDRSRLHGGSGVARAAAPRKTGGFRPSPQTARSDGRGDGALEPERAPSRPDASRWRPTPHNSRRQLQQVANASRLGAACGCCGVRRWAVCVGRCRAAMAIMGIARGDDEHPSTDRQVTGGM